MPAPGMVAKTKAQSVQRLCTLEYANHPDCLPLRTLRQPKACIRGQLASIIEYDLWFHNLIPRKYS
jgi:hypothetical protein